MPSSSRPVARCEADKDGKQSRGACVAALWAHYADSGEGSGEYRAALQAFIDELPETVTNQRLQNGSFWYPAVSATVLKRGVGN